MKTTTTLMLLFIFGISGLKATSQSPKDSVINLLSRRWYLTKVSGGIMGGSYIYRPGAGDSLIIGNIPETDSISWDAYSHCKNTASYRYQVSYGTSMHGDGWMLNSLNGPSKSILKLWKLIDGSYLMELADNYYDGYTYQYVTVDTFTLHKIPLLTSTTGGTRCGPGEITLEAKADPGAIKWYADSTGGAVLDTGAFFTTPVLDTTTVYYAEANEGGCVTPRVPVHATLYNPQIVNTIGGACCGTGVITLYAEAASGTVNWYTTVEGDTAIFTGNTFITPSLEETTTYYVDAEDHNCTSESRTPVLAIISRHDTCMTTSTHSNLTSSIRVYPNPTSGKVSISFNQAVDGEVSIDLVDSKGCFIRSISFAGDDISTDLSSYPSGMYFIKLGTSGGNYWFKVLKQ